MVKTVLKTNGPLGFYQGLTSTIVREIPGYFCFFGAYELCRTSFADHMGTDKESIGMLISFCYSCLSLKLHIKLASFVGRRSPTHVQRWIWRGLSLAGGLSNRLCEVKDPGLLFSWEAGGFHEDLLGYYTY